MNDLATVANPFGQSVSVQQDNAIANSDTARSIQEVQAAMIIAKKFPRDQRAAMDRIINACTRPTLAEAALYSYQRGGTEVTGPSIRLAEAMAQAWGNMQFGIRELSTDGSASTVEAFAWDMETNTRQVKVFQVGHNRYTKTKGVVKLTDPRDIYEVIANQGARRLRACILGVIPGDVTEEAVKQCDITQANTVDIEPAAIKAMLDAYAQYGVSQELIEKRIGRRAEAINAPLMLNLRRIMRSLMDGMSKPSDWFEIEDGGQPVGPKVSDLTEELKSAPAPAPRKRNPKAPPDPVPEVVQETADESVTPRPDDYLPWSDEPPMPTPEPAAPTYAGVSAAINAAHDPASLQAAVTLMTAYIASLAGHANRTQHKDELTDMYRWKLADLKAVK